MKRASSLGLRSATILADRAAGFAIAILLARWSGAPWYGEYTLAAAIISSLINITDFGTTPALLISGSQAVRVDSRWFRSVLRLKLVLGILFLAVGAGISAFTSHLPSATVVVLVFAGESIANITRTFQTLLMSEGRFAYNLWITLLARISHAVLIAISWFVFPTPEAILASSIIFYAGIAIVLSQHYGIWLRSSHTPAFSFRETVRGYGTLAWNQVVIHLADRFDAIVLGIMLPLSVVGIYGVGYAFYRNTRLMTSTLSTVYLPNYGNAFRLRDGDSVRRLARESFGWAISLGVVTSFVLFFWADDLVQLLFGGAYMEAAIVVRLLSPGVLLMYCGTIAANILNASGDSRTPLRAAIIASVMNILGNILLTPTYGFRSAAILTVASEVLHLLILIPQTHRVLTADIGR